MIRPEKHTEKPKEHTKEDAVNVFVGKDVTVALRGETKLKGRLEMATRYEIILTIDSQPVLVMKNAINYIELAELPIVKRSA